MKRARNFRLSGSGVRPPGRPAAPVRKRAGLFSLIELLVVVAIIMILLSILFPGLKLSRELAKQELCQGQLSQFGKVISMYADDYDEWYLPYAWDEKVAPYIGFDWSKRSSGKAFSIFHCPAGLPSKQQWAHANSLTLGYVFNYYARCSENTNGTGSRRTIKRPGDTFWMLDGRYDSVLWGGNLETYLGTNHATRLYSDRIQYIAYRHAHKANALFMEGHVKAAPSSGLYQNGGFVPSGVRFFNNGTLY